MGKQPLVVLGFGGNATDAIATIQTRYEIVAFVDDDTVRQGRSFGRIPVMSRSGLLQHPNAKVVSMIGSESTFSRRDEIIGNFHVPISRYATIVHPKANVSRYATIGHDVVIFAGVTIPSNAHIGNHVFILPNTVIHHDVSVSDYTIIGSGVVIAGNVKIGRSCYIGSGSTIKNDLEIGEETLMGMSANVVKSCDKSSILVGNPARDISIRRRKM